MSEYKNKLTTYFAGGSVMACLGIARELGVVKVFFDADGPLTSQQVADKLNMRERYVRELLGALAVGGVIDVDETSSVYSVTDANKITFRDTAIMARQLLVFGEKAEDVKKCFYNDGPYGVGYSRYSQMFDILEEFMVFIHQDLVEADILSVIPELATKLEDCITVAEFGCASGKLLNRLSQRFPKSTFLGVDVNDEQISKAKREAEIQSITNVAYCVHDLENLPESYTMRFDWILTHDVIHDMQHPQKALKEIYRCLKPSGIYSMIEPGLEGSVHDNVANLHSTIYYCTSVFNCLPTGSQTQDSACLGATVGKELIREMAAKAGFIVTDEVASKSDELQIHFVCRK